MVHTLLVVSSMPQEIDMNWYHFILSSYQFLGIFPEVSMRNPPQTNVGSLQETSKQIPTLQRNLFELSCLKQQIKGRKKEKKACVKQTLKNSKENHLI